MIPWPLPPAAAAGGSVVLAGWVAARLAGGGRRRRPLAATAGRAHPVAPRAAGVAEAGIVTEAAVFAAGVVSGSGAGYGLGRADAGARVLDLLARCMGGSWYTPALRCPGCGRRRHVLRYVRAVRRHLCVTCAGAQR